MTTYYPRTKRPKSVVALVALEAFYGIMGIISGLLLISDPSGAALGFTEPVRNSIPFHSFLPVGLFLLVVYGLGGLLLAYGSWTRKELFFQSISKVGGKHWAWQGGMALIAVLVVWLVVEGYLIGLNFAATYMTILIGVAIFNMLILPSTRRYYAVKEKP